MIHIQNSRVGPEDPRYGSGTSVRPLDHELWAPKGQNHLFLFFQATTPTHLIFLEFFLLDILEWPLSLPGQLCTGVSPHHVTQI